MHLGGDFRYAARQLRKAPGFAALALAALALGIGATTAIFSVVDTVLLKPLPFRESGCLLALWEKDPALGRDRNYVAPVNFLEWRKQSRTVETMAAIQNLRVNIGGGSGEAEEVKAERVSAVLFPMLGVQPALGRAFQEHEDQPGAAKVAILGHSLWQRRFGSDRLVIGKSLRVRDSVYTIVGVLGSGFSILEPGVDVWMPLVLKPADPLNNGRYVAVIGRRRASASLQQVRREMELIGEQSERALPAVNTGWRPSIFGLHEEMVFDARRPLWVLMGACCLLLLMACANVANLLLVRGSARRKEIATCAALGAPRSRLIAQLLSESLMLALGGGLLGLILGGAAVAAVARFGPADVPRIAQASLDLRLFGFAFAASVLSGILFGIVPALHGSRGDLSGALNEGGRGGSSGRAGRTVRKGLAVFEVAMAVVVLIASGLLIRSFIRLRTASPGFEPSGVLTMRIPLGGARNASPEQRVAFTDLVIGRIAAMPGVRSIGAVNGLPLNGLGNGADFSVEGGSGPPSIRHPNGLMRSVTTGYFQTIRVPLIAGRFFSDADSQASKPVVLINQTLARQFFPSRDPLGKRMEVRTNEIRYVEIVGVVGDIKAERFETEDWPMIYNPNAQVPFNTASLVVRTAGPPAAMATAIAGEIRRIEPEQVVAEVRPMTEFVDQAIAGARFNTALLTTFAGIAFLLASVGIYGVISYEVTERTNEIGIRMALGALPRDVLRLVMGQGARLAAAGIALGLVTAFWAARLMSAMLYGVEPDDAWTFAAISILLAAVALIASYVPSRRAMSLDPVAALRQG